MAEATITVSVEAAVTAAIRALFDHVYAEHGLRIDHVTATWLVGSSLTKDWGEVESLTVQTTQVRARPKPESVADVLAEAAQ